METERFFDSKPMVCIAIRYRGESGGADSC